MDLTKVESSRRDREERKRVAENREEGEEEENVKDREEDQMINWNDNPVESIKSEGVIQIRTGELTIVSVDLAREATQQLLSSSSSQSLAIKQLIGVKFVPFRAEKEYNHFSTRKHAK